MQLPSDGEQVELGEQPAIRIVRVGDDNKPGIRDGADVADFGNRVAGERSRPPVLRISRRHDGGAARPDEAGNERQQNLGAGRRHHMGSRGRAVGLRGSGSERSHRIRLRQAREGFRREIG